MENIALAQFLAINKTAIELEKERKEALEREIDEAAASEGFAMVRSYRNPSAKRRRNKK